MRDVAEDSFIRLLMNEKPHKYRVFKVGTGNAIYVNVSEVKSLQEFEI